MKQMRLKFKERWEAKPIDCSKREKDSFVTGRIQDGFCSQGPEEGRVRKELRRLGAGCRPGYRTT